MARKAVIIELHKFTRPIPSFLVLLNFLCLYKLMGLLGDIYTRTTVLLGVLGPSSEACRKEYNYDDRSVGCRPLNGGDGHS